MKNKILLLLALHLFLYTNLKAQSNSEMKLWANSGNVGEKFFNYELPFRYVNGYIFIDVVQNGKTYNFLFDTGAEATVIDTSIINEFNLKDFGISEASGPLVKKQDLKTRIVSEINILDLTFVNIGAISIDLSFLESKFCERVYGIIGSNLIKKAVWQIDYKKSLINVVDHVEKLAMKNFIKLKTIPQKKEWGTESVMVNLDGNISKFQVDTGNGRYGIVANPINFHKMINDKSVKKIQYGLKKANYSYKVKVKKLRIGTLEQSNQVLNLDNEVGNFQLIGNRFFDKYLLTLDLNKHFIYLKSNDKNEKDLNNFDLILKPNYKTGKIIIKKGLKQYLKKNKLKLKEQVIAINGVNVADLQKEAFCNYIDTIFSKLILTSDKIDLIVLSKGRKKIITITKLNKL